MRVHKSTRLPLWFANLIVRKNVFLLLRQPALGHWSWGLGDAYFRGLAHGTSGHSPLDKRGCSTSVKSTTAALPYQVSQVSSRPNPLLGVVTGTSLPRRPSQHRRHDLAPPVKPLSVMPSLSTDQICTRLRTSRGSARGSESVIFSTRRIRGGEVLSLEFDNVWGKQELGIPS